MVMKSGSSEHQNVEAASSFLGKIKKWDGQLTPRGGGGLLGLEKGTNSSPTSSEL